MQKIPNNNIIIRKGRNKHTITDIAPSAATSRMTITRPVTAKQPSPTKSDQPVKRKKKQENKKTKERPQSPPTKSIDYPTLEQIMDPIYYEHRTVNSAADITKNNDETEELPRKRLKRRKIAPIDSEVELLIREPAHLDLSKRSLPPKAKQQLGAIKATMDRVDVLEEKLKKKGKDKKKLSNTASPESPLTSSKEKPKLKRTLEVQTVLEKYPILKDSELVKKFLSVSMTNNQKGRIRQVIKDILHGTSTSMLPEVINNRIQAILKSSQNLTDTDLRKIRILYNMLKKATEENKMKEDESLEKKKKILVEEIKDDKVKVKNKEKKQKRYVVFVGNLPIHITKEEILAHFSNLRECIKDVRIPPREEGKKSSIAYLELDNEPSFQLALSQHHSMMGSKRINVLYTTHKNSKMSKAQAKAKGAKLIAMGKNGQLIGSRPAHKKRSHRRNKMKQALKDAENAEAARNLLTRHPAFATSH